MISAPQTKFSAWPVEKKKLCALARECPGNYLIEIGCFMGLTSLSLARVARDFDKTLICIDPWNNSQDDSGEDIYQEFRRNTDPYRDVISVIRKSSQEAIPDLPHDIKENVALVFVDGDHTYPGPLKDMRQYYPLLKKGGAMAVHDVFDEYWGEDSNRSLREFSEARLVQMLFYRPTEREIEQYEHKESGLAWFYKK